MRKILMALPCLLICGFVSAKEASSPDTLRGADSLLMGGALDATYAERPVIGKDGALEAANAKKKPIKTDASNTAATKTAAVRPAPAAAGQPSDTSKRFNMTQDGKQMTADDFDAWMKKNGYRVATGAPAKAAEPEPQKAANK